MKNLLGLIMVFIITSCQSQSNILKDVENLQKLHNEQNQNSGKSKIYLGRGFKPIKTILNSLKSELENNNIILIFSWANTMPIANTNTFYALIYDVNKGKSYYAYNKRENYKNIIVENKSNRYFIDQEYLLNEYLKNRTLNHLQKFENQSNSAEVGTDYYLFDTKNRQVYCLEDIVFEEGKPAKYD
ncbi:MULTISPECIES: hypothetical protein [unclassified Chryseobacterium]|uniref:hypothetical protein n=1 Tax=unclassified Chryseobacterium TaxID=2593645 RepID=UPI00100ADF6E|nr:MULTISPECIES: hypothetical protein [unclassified Chryseobacterium]RXM50631.1 hypothetical protein BOQ64_17990 [Chryseobacterium sp. CH25]RXM63265.1 hypothetical protein BOQ60_18185 [Chryseobacterium sp. CH1]